MEREFQKTGKWKLYDIFLMDQLAHPVPETVVRTIRGILMLLHQNGQEKNSQGSQETADTGG